jgi:hypothetical protein
MARLRGSESSTGFNLCGVGVSWAECEIKGKTKITSKIEGKTKIKFKTKGAQVETCATGVRRG